MKLPAIFILVMSLLETDMLSQNILAHEKKVFVNPEGRVFINKSLPVYFRVSTSPDENAKSYSLPSEATSRYANPMYLDTEGRNTLRSPSAVDTVTKKVVLPLQDVQFNLYADGIAPVSSIEIKNTKIFYKGTQCYVSDSTLVTIQSKDQSSGVDNIYYSVDSTPYKPYVNNLDFKSEKKYVIKCYSVDKVGNVETPKTQVLYVDKTKPNTTLKVSGDYNDSILAGNSVIKLTSEDNESGVYKTIYKLNNDIERLYTGPIYASLLKQGEYSLKYYSVDNLNQKEDEHEFKFYIDKTPPTVIEEIIGKNFIANGVEYSSGASKLKITSFDNKAGVKEIYYSINNSEYKLYDKPVTLSDIKGTLKISSYALDKVNNRSSGQTGGNIAKTIPYVDLSGPTLGYAFNGSFYEIKDTLFICEKTKIKLWAKDMESGLNKVEYQVDSNGIETYQQPFSLDKEGKHIIRIYGYDRVGNINTQDMLLRVDTTGPEVFYQFSVPSRHSSEVNGTYYETYPSSVVLFLSAKDLQVGYGNMSYSINDMPEKAYTCPIQGLPHEGIYSISVYATDKLNNRTQKKIDFCISGK